MGRLQKNGSISPWQADSQLKFTTRLDDEFGMDLTALCNMLGENDTNGCNLAGYGEYVAFACHFVATHPLPHCRSATAIGYASKNYLKWLEIQLAIHPIVGG